MTVDENLARITLDEGFPSSMPIRFRFGPMVAILIPMGSMPLVDSAAFRDQGGIAMGQAPMLSGEARIFFARR